MQLSITCKSWKSSVPCESILSQGLAMLSPGFEKRLKWEHCQWAPFCRRIGVEAHLREHSFGLGIKPQRPIEAIGRTWNSLIIPLPGEDSFQPHSFWGLLIIYTHIVGREKGEFAQYFVCFCKDGNSQEMSRSWVMKWWAWISSDWLYCCSFLLLPAQNETTLTDIQSLSAQNIAAVTREVFWHSAIPVTVKALRKQEGGLSGC